MSDTMRRAVIVYAVRHIAENLNPQVIVDLHEHGIDESDVEAIAREVQHKQFDRCVCSNNDELRHPLLAL